MSEANFSFLNKIPDQCGYLVFSEGALIKSEGELENREFVMSIAEKILRVPRTDELPKEMKFNQITIQFSKHFYTISQSGKYVYIVKRRCA